MFKKKKSEDEEILTGEAELAAEETETELPVDEEPSAVEAAEAETDLPSEEGPGPESGEPDADKPEADKTKATEPLQAKDALVEAYETHRRKNSLTCLRTTISGRRTAARRRSGWREG